MLIKECESGRMISFLKEKKKKPPSNREARSNGGFRCKYGLVLGSANGTYGSAGTTLDAGISIDNILAIASGDSGNGALSLAAAASYAIITNFVSHSVTPPSCFTTPLYHIHQKNQ